MDKLTKARSVFEKIHVIDDGLFLAPFNPILVTDHPDFTVLVSPAYGFPNEPPYIDVIRNDDLVTLLDFTERMMDGDELFDEFDGPLTNINGIDDIVTCFQDLYFTYTERDRKGLTTLRDIESDLEFKKAKPYLKVVQ